MENSKISLFKRIFPANLLTSLSGKHSVKMRGMCVGKILQQSTKLPTVESLCVERLQKALWQTDFSPMWINVENIDCPPRDKKCYPVDNGEFGMRSSECGMKNAS